MKLQGVSVKREWIKFRQWWHEVSYLTKIAIMLLSGAKLAPVYAIERQASSETKLHKSQEERNYRRPANFVPNDDIENAPEEVQNNLWLQNLLVEDDAGVLNSVRNDLKTWREKEEYVKQWNLQSSGPYASPSDKYKKKYLAKKMLRYIDKRLNGEIKRAEKGTTLQKIGEVHKALRPKAEAQISKNVKLRFKARVLQGKLLFFLQNPYIDYQANIKANGKIHMHAKREIKDLKLSTGIDYDVRGGYWIARVDRPITKKINARISSTQSDKKMAFSKSADKKLEFFFKRSF